MNNTIQAKQNDHTDDFLDIYQNMRGYDNRPIIEDMEPGKVYTLEFKNAHIVNHATMQNEDMKDKYFTSVAINFMLVILIICITIFSYIKISQLADTLKSMDSKAEEISQMQQSSQILSETLSEKISETTFITTDSILLEDIIEEDIDIESNGDIDLTVLEKYEAVPLNNDLKMYIYNTAVENGIPPEIFFSIAWQETRYDPDAISSTNDHGLFQINECNFEYLANRFGWTLEEFWDKIYDPYVNTDCAIIILGQCYNNYRNDNWHHVLMRYNLGPSGAEEFFRDSEYSTEYSRSALGYAADTFGFTDIVIS